MNIFSRQSGLFALALLLAGSLIAAKFPTATKQYDYVTVAQYGGTVTVTTGSTKAEDIKYKLEGNYSNFNFTPVLRKVEELEAQGYEVVTNNAGGNAGPVFNYFLLRKPK